MKIIISTHILTNGPSQELQKYLNDKKVEKLLWISHPLRYNLRLKGNGYKVWKKGKLIEEKYEDIKKLPSLFSYIKDFWLNFWYVIKNRDKYDVYIGFNNLNALSGLALKKIGKVEKCIYYVVDYVPQRFENILLNKIYHFLESFCAIHCDEIWNLSLKMIEAREKFKGLKKENSGIQKVVPMGIWFHEIKRNNIEKVHKHQLVFMGGVVKKQGIQYTLKAIPLIIKEIPDFIFLVIGDGRYINELKKLAKKLAIKEHVEFIGYIKNHEQIDEIIAESAVAVALYEKGDFEKNWTYYTDPGKIKSYLGAGVPVILTDVPHNAREIQKRGCGLIINPDPKSIANAVVNLMKDEGKLKRYRKNATNYAKQFDWNIIFEKNLGKIL